MKPGPPGPLCKSGCGTQCKDCDDGGGTGGCRGPTCNHCIGLGCPSGSDCIGSGCDSGGRGSGNSNDPDETKSCSESSTVTDCSVDCNVGPESGSLSTSCYSTTCSQHVGCETTGTTTTSETTTACPIELPYTVSYGPEGQIPLMGGGGDSGEIIYAGLIGPNRVLYDPGEPVITTSAGTTKSTSTSSAQPAPTGSNIFYVWNWGGTGPNPMGSNPVNFIGAGIAPALDWSCETIQKDLSNSDPNQYPYVLGKDGSQAAPDVFTLDPSGVCDENLMTFTKQDDGSYWATSQGQGGRARCTLANRPATLTCTGAMALDAKVTPLWTCMGDICGPGGKAGVVYCPSMDATDCPCPDDDSKLCISSDGGPYTCVCGD